VFETAAVIEQKVISPNLNGVSAGDIALVDVQQLCAAVSDPAAFGAPQALTQAATSLRESINIIIQRSYPVVGTTPYNFAGLSVLYYPTASQRAQYKDDNDIWLELDTTDSYMRLLFAQDATWTQLVTCAGAHVPFVFEQR
jgi:hypothetical protein